MLWRKGCFRGTRMTCQDSSWHWNALPSPSTNTRKLITPLSLAATTNHPLWPPQLPQCCSFHGTPYAHLLPPISSCEFAVSVPSCSFISSGPFHCQMPYKQLGPPLHIPPRPLWGGTHIQDLFRVMPHPGFRFSGLFQRDITSVINYGSKHCLARVVWRQAPSFSTSDVHWYKTLLCNLPVQKSCFFTHNTLRKSSALTFAQSSSDFTCSKTDNVEHFNVKHFRAFFFFPPPLWPPGDCTETFRVWGQQLLRMEYVPRSIFLPSILTWIPFVSHGFFQVLISSSWELGKSSISICCTACEEQDPAKQGFM